LALLRGRNYVLPQDVVAIAPEVLRHRVVLSYEALAEGVEPDMVIEHVLHAIPAPQIAPSQDRVVRLPAEDTA
jgi:MoxR-like ATPase